MDPCNPGLLETRQVLVHWRRAKPHWVELGDVKRYHESLELVNVTLHVDRERWRACPQGSVAWLEGEPGEAGTCLLPLRFDHATGEFEPSSCDAVVLESSGLAWCR